MNAGPVSNAHSMLNYLKTSEVIQNYDTIFNIWISSSYLFFCFVSQRDTAIKMVPSMLEYQLLFFKQRISTKLDKPVLFTKGFVCLESHH